MMDVEKYGVVGLLFVAGILALVLFYGPDEEPETAGTKLQTDRAANASNGARRAPRPGGRLAEASIRPHAAAPSSRTVHFELAGTVEGPNSEPFNFADRDQPSFQTPASQLAGGRCSYEIESGDILGRIAKRFLGDAQHASKLLAWNPKLDPMALQVGQLIRLCPPGQDAPLSSAGAAPRPAQPQSLTSASRFTYKVAKGDVLSAIAERRLGSIAHTEALFQANRHLINHPDELALGMELTLPKVGSLVDN